jgi:hypothetical protein
MEQIMDVDQIVHFILRELLSMGQNLPLIAAPSASSERRCK